jgi:hypothetical protein
MWHARPNARTNGHLRPLGDAFMAKIGGNTFTNVLVPLAFENRYFVLLQDNPPILNVLHDGIAGPEWEILSNEPGRSSISVVSKTPPGIVTVTDRATGKFIYKVRPGSETSIVFGTLQGDQVECVIRDGYLKVGGMTFECCGFGNLAVGVRLHSNGAIDVGGSAIPPAVLKALRPRAA